MKDIFINAPILALIFILLVSILTWTKPDLNRLFIFISIFAIAKLFQALKHNYRNHLEKISLDSNNGKIIINHYKPVNKRTEIIMDLKEIEISEIKNIPISWFSFENYFFISDKSSRIKISTAGLKNREINLNEIHSELRNITLIYNGLREN